MRICLTALLCLSLALPSAAGTLNYGPFGDVVVSGNPANCTQVAIVLSSAKGLGKLEERIGAVLEQEGALVIGVDTGRYLREANASPDRQNISYDLESLSKFVQKNLSVPRLHTPLLIGYADGATMVYANLVQAPEGTFAGGIAIGFRPGLELRTPFGEGRGLTCNRSSGGLRFSPVLSFPLDLTVIQAETDPVFSFNSTDAFMKGIPHVTTVMLPQVSDYERYAAWDEPLRKAAREMAARTNNAAEIDADKDLAGLPLNAVKATAPSDVFAVFISGDGGWAGLDKDISEELASRGIDVAGLDSLKYFWKRRTPEEGGQDLARIIRHFMKAWHKDRVLLIGYSLGADALAPFIANLPDETRHRILLAALLSPGRNAELEFHVTDWLGSDDTTQGFPLLPVIRRLSGVPLLCMYGEEDAEGLCPLLNVSEAKVERLPGAHHFKGDYKGVANVILRHAGFIGQDAPAK